MTLQVRTIPQTKSDFLTREEVDFFFFYNKTENWKI